MKERERLRLFLWTIGLTFGLIFSFLRLIRAIRIFGLTKEKVVPRKEGLLVVYRHPSLREPLFLPFLFFPWFLSDLSFLPFSTPDNKNYYQRWWFSIFRLVCIPIPRGRKREEKATLEEIKHQLIQGKSFLIAPGGGREWKGREFKVIRNSKIEIVKVSSEKDFSMLNEEANGKIIRRFKPGVGWLIQDAAVKVLPIWVEAKRMQLKIVIGELLQCPKKFNRKEIVEFLENNMLSLGEK